MAACLPYLLLSVFVDFIHLHPLLTSSASPVSERVAAETRDARLPDSTCIVCQWMRAGTGLQPSVAAGPTIVALGADVTPPPEACAARPALLSPDFRGPPLSLFS